MSFKLTSDYQPTGDQPEAIRKLVDGIQANEPAQVLLGVTGSGKTFTMANVIAQLNRPVLVLTHNKTLTAQLYGEFREFFPENAVEYFVSYYDYYQPEAYISTSDTYIEKDLAINEEVDKLRLRATSSLLSGRRDIIVVASVSCIYGMGNPEDYKNGIIRIKRGDVISRTTFLYNLVEILYNRTEGTLSRGNFRVKGDTVDIYLPYVDYGYRITFFGDEIEEIEMIDVNRGTRMEVLEHAAIFPANLYVAPRDRLQQIIRNIEDELNDHKTFFENEQRYLEAKRIHERVSFDLEMIRELGYCNGVENYSRFFDGRKEGTRPFCLLDYFPDDYLMSVPRVTDRDRGKSVRQDRPQPRALEPRVARQISPPAGGTIFRRRAAERRFPASRASLPKSPSHDAATRYMIGRRCRPNLSNVVWSLPLQGSGGRLMGTGTDNPDA
jgi:excinuclease ABC subunit B